MAKRRLDQLVVERGLARSREEARRLILAGQIRVNGQTGLKAGSQVSDEAQVELDRPPPFVSRGGEKLEAALAGFRIEVTGRVCLDVGASTGGFTDALLQRGARKVYAVDVGYGQLDWKLRSDPRVVVMERTNARHLQALPEPIALAAVDVSFISLRLILPAVLRLLSPQGEVVALIKPQFEAGPAKVSRGGVVRDPATHREVLQAILDEAQRLGLVLRGLMASPLRGPAGNVEFLTYWERSGQPVPTKEAIERALAAVEGS